MSEEITLTETGKGPIKFMGETICVVSTFEPEGPKSGRWWKVGVHTRDGEVGYYIGLGHLTCWLGERHRYWVLRAKNEKSIFELINHYVTDKPDREKLNIKIKEKLDERVGSETTGTH